MKTFTALSFSLPLIVGALVTGTANAAPPSPLPGTVLVAGFSQPVAGNGRVVGGVIFRHVQYDASHYRESVASALRITPNSAGLSGLDIDRGEVVARFSRGGAIYGECIMRRAFNDDFDRFVGVKLAERSPHGKAGETLIVATGSAAGNSRSFFSESVAFSADGVNYLYKPNDGICNTNLGPTASGTAIVGGIPAVQAGDTVDVYILNMDNTAQPAAHVGTGILAGSDL